MSDCSHRSSRFGLAACVLALLLAGCTVGPEFVKPTPAAPDDWTSWRAADEALRLPIGAEQPIPSTWWTALGDPLLDRLQARALKSSPDLQIAALHFAQARVQRSTTAAQQVPEIGLNGGVNRQRQSEYAAGTRMLDLIGSNRDALAKALSEPFTFYQAGFDASWEIDLWGRVRRSIEAAGLDPDNLPEASGGFYGLLCWNKLFDIRLFRDKGVHFDETMFFGDDASELHRVYDGEYVYCVPRVLYHYRRRGGQMTEVLFPPRRLDDLKMYWNWLGWFAAHRARR